MNENGMFWAAEISLAKALELNKYLIDDDKVAFQLGTTDLKYLVPLKFAEENIDKSEYVDIQLSQEEVDGTTPVTKLRRIYP